MRSDAYLVCALGGVDWADVIHLENVHSICCPPWVVVLITEQEELQLLRLSVRFL